MTIDASDFKAQGKPTAEQARTVYDSLPHQTCDTLVAALTHKGYAISRATAARWIKSGFTKKAKPGPATNMDKGEVKGVAGAVATATAIVTAAESMVGSELTTEQISQIQRDLNELKPNGKPLDKQVLKALQESERLVYNIMLLRFSQRIADKLVLIPRDSAALVKSMTEADESLSAVPAANLPGNGDNAKLIEATANPPNPVSEGIAAFKKRHAAAA